MTDKTHDADVAFIRALAELLRENDLTEVQVKREYGEDNALNVRVSRVVAPSQPAPHAMPIHDVAPQPAEAPAAEPHGAGVPADPSLDPGAVTSPMVGTAYLQPEPGAPPFVSVGATVEEGETLLIVEAMKTMNQIPSPRSGTVRRVLVADGDPVEYGAPLMIVD